MVTGEDLRRVPADPEFAGSVLQALPDGVIAIDPQGRVLLVNDAAVRLLDASGHWHQGAGIEPLLRLLGREAAARLLQALEVMLRSSSGAGAGAARVIPVSTDAGRTLEIRLAVLADGAGAIVLLRDVTDELAAQGDLHYRATHDALTGLMNRVEFQVRVREHLDHARASGVTHALCFIDLDHFKVVNDTCGHPTGDRMLRELCDWLRGHVRKNDILARLGGDEFGLLLDSCQEDDAVGIARELLQAVQNFQFRSDDKTFQIGASIGIVSIEPNAAFESLMHAADAACYTAKQKGRNRIEVNRFLSAGRAV